MTTTITRLYDTDEQARDTVRDLEASGIPYGDISIVANNTAGHARLEKGHPGAAAGAAVGGVVGGTAGLLAGIGLLAIPGIGPVVAAGWLVATGTGALIGAGAGGLIGALGDHGVNREDAEIYAEGIRRGGALVAVKTDERNAALVEDVLARHHFVDLPGRASAYREAGWSGFAADSTVPYTPAEIEAERRRNGLPPLP
jgi:hypothetical protein